MNLKRHRNAAARFVGGENPAFGLPVSGQWRITQGFDGPHTHKDLWAHAWDFEIFDDRQAPCRGPENERKSYYAYNMPVFAPADGKVVRVVHHVDDNPIGQVNVAQNWGNLVIIWHYDRVYTALCHLKKGSVGVAEGEEVRAVVDGTALRRRTHLALACAVGAFPQPELQALLEELTR